nr:immunoglobulin light chain junction region [Macaca mulatta]
DYHCQSADISGKLRVF